MSVMKYREKLKMHLSNMEEVIVSYVLFTYFPLCFAWACNIFGDYAPMFPISFTFFFKAFVFITMNSLLNPKSVSFTTFLHRDLYYFGAFPPPLFVFIFAFIFISKKTCEKAIFFSAKFVIIYASKIKNEPRN